MSEAILKKVKTSRPSKVGLQREWYLLDASKEPLGRLATKAARILMGKHKANYSPDVNMGGVVVIINAKHTILTGQKPLKKNYFHYSGYMGGMKVRSFPEVMAKDPTRPLYLAIKGMLPKNRHRDIRANRLLHVFPEGHSFTQKMIQAN
jgi:large subunit ribosomal protein L13